MVQDANLPDSQSAGRMKLSDENAKTIVRERAFIIDIKTFSELIMLIVKIQLLL